MTVPILSPSQLNQLGAWLRSILWDSKLPGRTDKDGSKDSGLDIHRIKARLPLSNGDVKLVQGVREVFEILDAPNPKQTSSEASFGSHGKIVLIGRYLLGIPFEESFKNMINSS